MKINHDYQSLADNIALDKFGYIKIQGHEGRDPEKRLYIRAYESKDSEVLCASYHLLEKQRESVKEVAARHKIKFNEIPDREAKTKIQQEFEHWMNNIKKHDIQKCSHYDKALECAKELSYGVVRGYWKNEISNRAGLIDMRRSAMRRGGEFTDGLDRMSKYLSERIGCGKSGSRQSYTSKRGAIHYHGSSEVGDMDSVIATMVGVGMLKKTDDSNIYELTGEAFALLREPSWFEKYHSKIAFWTGLISFLMAAVLWLREIT